MAGNGPCVSPATLTFRCSPSNQLVWNFFFPLPKFFAAGSRLNVARSSSFLFSRPGGVGFLSRDCVGGSQSALQLSRPPFLAAAVFGGAPSVCVSRNVAGETARSSLSAEFKLIRPRTHASCLVLSFSLCFSVQFSFFQSYREVHQFMVKSNRWVRDTNSPTTKKPIALSYPFVPPPRPNVFQKHSF